MKTLCIKTNNSDAIDYLLKNLKTLALDDVCFSCHKFKVYHNIIIHYQGNDLPLFLNTISNLLVFLVLDLFENNMTRKILQREYFYFDTMEKKQILNKIEDIYYEDTEKLCAKEDALFHCFYDFLEKNNTIFLKGFITFRLKKYVYELESILDDAVNQYLIEKEYAEFVSLLKLYVNAEKSTTDLVHLIYHKEESILLDQDKNVIKTDINLLNAKFLSDISFSSSDMVLNTLLNILPKKIYIHLMDEEADEFITTLELIFENRVQICRDCNICRIYRFGDGGKKYHF